MDVSKASYYTEKKNNKDSQTEHTKKFISKQGLPTLSGFETISSESSALTTRRRLFLQSEINTYN
jgi:hypothetical protein